MAQEVLRDEATEAARVRLSQYGIELKDGWSARSMLQNLYNRRLSTTYRHMNSHHSVADHNSSLRRATPISFDKTFNRNVAQEIMHCQQIPAHHVHDHIDQWEIEFLSGMSRAMRWIRDVDRGSLTTYAADFVRHPAVTMPNFRKADGPVSWAPPEDDSEYRRRLEEVGKPLEMAPKSFEPYIRLDSATRRKVQGQTQPFVESTGMSRQQLLKTEYASSHHLFPDTDLARLSSNVRVPPDAYF